MSEEKSISSVRVTSSTPVGFDREQNVEERPGAHT